MDAPQTAPRPLEEPAPIGEPRADALRRLIAVVDRLRAPDGCAWDLQQTLDSVAPHLVEESHELLEAVEHRDDPHAMEEAGDVLMGIVLLARIAEQEGRFDLARIAGGVVEKLVRRHPHVFGTGHAGTAAEALGNWEAVKRAEREGEQADASAMAGIPRALPALQRAQRTVAKAVAAGFRWETTGDALAKLREEVGELDEAVAATGGRPPAELEAAEREHLEHELGDVLVAAAFAGHYLGIDPERAARGALRRFEGRYRAMEASLGRPLPEVGLEEMLAAWNAAKRAERG